MKDTRTFQKMNKKKTQLSIEKDIMKCKKIKFCYKQSLLFISIKIKFKMITLTLLHKYKEL